MEKRTFKITLADGTALEGLTLNGNNYISDKKVTEDVFRDNLSKVTIEGPDGAQEHENMKLVQICKVGTKYWFILADKTADEVAKEAMEAKMNEMEQAMKVLLTGEVQAMDMMKSAAEMRTALQYFVTTLDAETQLDKMLEIPSMFPAYEVGKAYKVKDVISYGVNSVGDPQLYQVLQDHTSAAEWTPDTATSLYKAIGVTEGGYPVWVQPLGASDAYNTGDIVSHNGTLYISTMDGNVWSPETYPAGWEVYAE